MLSCWQQKLLIVPMLCSNRCPVAMDALLCSNGCTAFLAVLSHMGFHLSPTKGSAFGGLAGDDLGLLCSSTMSFSNCRLGCGSASPGLMPFSVRKASMIRCLTMAAPSTCRSRDLYSATAFIYVSLCSPRLINNAACHFTNSEKISANSYSGSLTRWGDCSSRGRPW